MTANAPAIKNVVAMHFGSQAEKGPTPESDPDKTPALPQLSERERESEQTPHLVEIGTASTTTKEVATGASTRVMPSVVQSTNHNSYLKSDRHNAADESYNRFAGAQ